MLRVFEMYNKVYLTNVFDKQWFWDDLGLDFIIDIHPGLLTWWLIPRIVGKLVGLIHLWQGSQDLLSGMGHQRKWRPAPAISMHGPLEIHQLQMMFSFRYPGVILKIPHCHVWLPSRVTATHTLVLTIDVSRSASVSKSRLWPKCQCLQGWRVMYNWILGITWWLIPLSKWVSSP